MSLSRLRALERLLRSPVSALAPSVARASLAPCPRRCLHRSPRLAAASQDLADDEEFVQDQEATRKTSKAMLAYLERASKHQEFMKQQQSEFEIGKRHLANMMGEDPEHFSQEDIDRSIEYLFPTGIFDKRARPHMRPPQEVFPQQKEAQFDETGRPYHTLFYTLRPNFFMTLHEVVEKMRHLEQLEDKGFTAGQLPDPAQKLSTLGSEWLSMTELGAMLVEKLRDVEYQEFLRAMNRLVEHPLSFHHKEFIFRFRKMLKATTETQAVPELVFDAAGRPYMAARGFRKTCVAEVTVRGRGSGQVTVNGTPLVQYFWRTGARSGNQDVAQVMYPLKVTGLLDALDVEAVVAYHGEPQRVEGQHHLLLPVQAPSAQAGAVRHALSLALRSFVDTEMRETMRIAGLLTRDVRERERYKPGKKKARKGRTFKKR